MRHLHCVSRTLPAAAAVPVDYKPGIVGVFQRIWIESKGIVF